MKPPLLFDAHLDLALNAIDWNRHLRRPLEDLRRAEVRLADKAGRGRGTVCFPEMRRANLGVCVATQLARLEHDAYSPVFGWQSQEQAWAMTQCQLAWYRAMEECGELLFIRDAAALRSQVENWRNSDGADCPIGCILSLEGADSLISPTHLERAWEAGLRIVGPAHYGPGVYAMGTAADGPFPPRGLDLLRDCARLGIILDVTHLSDACFWQAIDLYEGPLYASHHNSRVLVPHQRQLSDDMVRALVERGAVIGAACDAWMLAPGWIRGETTPQAAGVTLETLADHLDHFCQIAGNARHVGIGSDLDGAFGTEQTPLDLDSIADLQKLAAILSRRGYSREEIDGVFHGNFLRFFESALPRG